MMMLNHFTVSISSFQKLRFDEVRLVGDTLISWDLWNAKPFQLHNLEKLGNSMVRYGLQRARSQVHTSTLSPSAKKIWQSLPVQLFTARTWHQLHSNGMGSWCKSLGQSCWRWLAQRETCLAGIQRAKLPRVSWQIWSLGFQQPRLCDLCDLGMIWFCKPRDAAAPNSRFLSTYHEDTKMELICSGHGLGIARTQLRLFPICQVRVSRFWQRCNSFLSFFLSFFLSSSSSPAADAVECTSTWVPYRKIRRLWSVPGPDYNITRSGGCGVCLRPLYCELRCQIECQKECQNRCQIECQKECHTECQSICQKECQIECQNIYMP